MIGRNNVFNVVVTLRENIDGLSALGKAKRVAEIANLLKDKKDLNFDMMELNRQVKFTWKEEIDLDKST